MRIISSKDLEVVEVAGAKKIRCRCCGKLVMDVPGDGAVKLKPGTTELAAIPFAILGHVGKCG